MSRTENAYEFMFPRSKSSPTTSSPRSNPSAPSPAPGDFPGLQDFRHDPELAIKGMRYGDGIAGAGQIITVCDEDTGRIAQSSSSSTKNRKPRCGRKQPGDCCPLLSPRSSRSTRVVCSLSDFMASLPPPLASSFYYCLLRSSSGAPECDQ